MPTNLDRIQCLLQPEPYAKVRTLAKHNRRAMSAMAAELIETALKLPTYRDQLEEALVVVPPKDDPREAVKQTAISNRLQFEDALTKADKDGPDYLAMVAGLQQLKAMGVTSIDKEKMETLMQMLQLLQK